MVNIKFEFNHFRNLVIIIIAVSGTLFSYIVVADSSNQRYIQVDQDIWSFLKYVGVMFMAVIGWAGIQLVTSMKSLVRNVTDLNITVRITQNEIMQIKNEVAEINQKYERHGIRILELEKHQRN